MKSNKRFNILLISIDAFGADKCWNLNSGIMSAIKYLSDKGVSFTNIFSSTSSTTPSMFTINTGLYPKDHGVISTYGETLNKNVKTLAETLKKSGYYTVASVGGPLMEKTGIKTGYDKFNYYNPWLDIPLLGKKIRFNRFAINNFLIKKEFKKVLQSNAPWFHWVHMLDLHNRWRRRSFFKDNSYENALNDLDTKLNFFIKHINFSNTIVILCSDHGHYVKKIDGKLHGIDYPEAHGYNISDKLVKIPLIIVAPNINTNKVIEHSFPSKIIFNTIIDYAQKNLDTKTDSLLKYCYDFNVTPYQEKPIYLEACGSILKRKNQMFLHGIRYKNYKFVITKDNCMKNAELYDLINDPDEKKNVIDIEQSISKQMFEILIKESIKI